LKLRRANGPNFSWPLIMFSGAVSEKRLAAMGKIYHGKPLRIKSRKELIASIKPHYWQYLHTDNDDFGQLRLPPPGSGDNSSVAVVAWFVRTACTSESSCVRVGKVGLRPPSGGINAAAPPRKDPFPVDPDLPLYGILD
jgi:hypothetical protein